MNHRTKIEQANTQEDTGMIGFFLFMAFFPLICIAGIACAIHYASKIDGIPNWLVLTSVSALLVIFGVNRLIKMIKD